MGEIPPAEIRAEEGYAWCAACYIAHPLAGPTPASDSRDARRVSMPDYFKVYETADELTIRRRWYSPPVWFLALFCVMWLSGTTYFFLDSLRHHLLSLPFLLIFPVPVGIFLLYTVASLFLNVTDIVIAKGRLTVRHFPLPWPGKQDIPTSSIVQLYCRIERIPTKHKQVFEKGPRVHVVLGNRSEINLFKHLYPELQEALFIEQTIERYLGIPDIAVKGEVPVRIGRKPTDS